MRIPGATSTRLGANGGENPKQWLTKTDQAAEATLLAGQLNHRNVNLPSLRSNVKPNDNKPFHYYEQSLYQE